MDSSVSPDRFAISETGGLPSVRVPVLSNTTTDSVVAVSKLSPLRMKMPRRAASPVPTMVAAGVAMPNAQGQATSNTEMAWVIARSGPTPAANQPRKVRAETPMTAGMKTVVARSTLCCTGSLLFWARSTRWMIPANTVSVPTAVVRTRNAPLPLTQPPTSLAPMSLMTGMISPVIKDSSTVDSPSITTPSAGIRSPGRTKKMSPTLMSSMSTEYS